MWNGGEDEKRVMGEAMKRGRVETGEKRTGDEDGSESYTCVTNKALDIKNYNKAWQQNCKGTNPANTKE